MENGQWSTKRNFEVHSTYPLSGSLSASPCFHFGAAHIFVPRGIIICKITDKMQAVCADLYASCVLSTSRCPNNSRRLRPAVASPQNAVRNFGKTKRECGVSGRRASIVLTRGKVQLVCSTTNEAEAAAGGKGETTSVRLRGYENACVGVENYSIHAQFVSAPILTAFSCDLPAQSTESPDAKAVKFLISKGLKRVAALERELQWRVSCESVFLECIPLREYTIVCFPVVSNLAGEWAIDTLLQAYSAASQHAYWSEVVLSTNVYDVVECLESVGIKDQLPEPLYAVVEASH
eukprot:3665460-Pyramimonas_sp.AAC.1